MVAAVMSNRLCRGHVHRDVATPRAFLMPMKRLSKTAHHERQQCGDPHNEPSFGRVRFHNQRQFRHKFGRQDGRTAVFCLLASIRKSERQSASENCSFHICGRCIANRAPNVTHFSSDL